MISPAMEDYLKVMYELEEMGEPITTSTLAEWLDVAPASVTKMVKRLAEIGLVDHEPYHGISLTSRGEMCALEVVRHHRLIELFLTEVLGIPWDRVHEEAHRLEHVVSEYVVERMANALEDPLRDPHGRPIPDRSRGLIRPDTDKLATIEPGQSVTVVSVDDEDPVLLRYVGGLGLYPNTPVEVLAREPFGGSLRLQVGDSERSLGIEAAEHVWVRSN